MNFVKILTSNAHKKVVPIFFTVTRMYFVSNFQEYLPSYFLITLYLYYHDGFYLIKKIKNNDDYYNRIILGIQNNIIN